MDLEFGGRRRKPDIRYLFDMKDVIFDRNWLEAAENIELYFMFRDLFLSRSDEKRLIEQGLRYDITIIPPRMLGREYIKTAGHYHPSVPGGTVTYPELYEVLEGEALYLMQNHDLSDIIVVNAWAGDKVLVPPNFGHITINRSNKTLKMANFVARNFSSLYDPIKDRAGGAYFFTKDGWIKNERCPEAAELRIIDAPQAAKIGLSKGREMYPLLREPGKLEYLTRPEEHLDLFEDLI